MNGRGLNWLFTLRLRASPYAQGERGCITLQCIAKLTKLDIDVALEVRHTNAMSFVLI